ncbi:hypothetical protein SESBI_48546 [Sesbania bispinosa]|nr:hypothetical protein SESBI_48546 [Sesbania bispinosa]
MVDPPSSPILSAPPFTAAPFVTIPHPSGRPPPISRIVSVRCKAKREIKVERKNQLMGSEMGKSMREMEWVMGKNGEK